MARDPLRVLLMLRQREVELARQMLGNCLEMENDAAGKIKVLDEITRRDRAAISYTEELLAFGEMFTARRSTTQVDRRSAVAALANAEHRSAAARTVVTTARTAAEAVQTLIQEREAARNVETSRAEQHALDDIARPRRAQHD